MEISGSEKIRNLTDDFLSTFASGLSNQGGSVLTHCTTSPWIPTRTSLRSVGPATRLPPENNRHPTLRHGGDRRDAFTGYGDAGESRDATDSVERIRCHSSVASRRTSTAHSRPTGGSSQRKRPSERLRAWEKATTLPRCIRQSSNVSVDRRDWSSNSSHAGMLAPVSIFASRTFDGKRPPWLRFARWRRWPRRDAWKMLLRTWKTPIDRRWRRDRIGSRERPLTPLIRPVRLGG